MSRADDKETRKHIDNYLGHDHEERSPTWHVDNYLGHDSAPSKKSPSRTDEYQAVPYQKDPYSGSY